MSYISREGYEDLVYDRLKRIHAITYRQVSDAGLDNRIYMAFSKGRDPVAVAEAIAKHITGDGEDD